MSEEMPPLPRSLEKLVEFFDTHDMGDYMEQMPEATFEPGPNSKPEASAALIKKLWEAFPPLDPLSPQPPPPLPGETFIDLGDDPVTLRSNLSLFCPEDLKGMLGEVLTELLGASDRTDAEMVIYMLDVPVFETEESLAETERFLGPAAVEQTKEENQHHRAFLAKTFPSFTSVQASALEDWLRAVQGWPELEYARDSVQSALGYWAKRARE